MPPQKARQAAPKKKGAAAKAARAEAKPEPKTAKWNGLTLELPDAMPSTMLFDVVEYEASDGDDPTPLLRLLRELVGPEQFQQIRYRIPRDDDGTAVAGAMQAVFEPYGMTPGKP